MPSQRTIKNKIRSVEKTHQVTKAMEAVSGVKMRKAQMRALTARPYAMAALRILRRISGSVDISRHPLIASQDAATSTPKRVLAIVITSDKGLAGGINSSLLRHVTELLKEKGVSREHIGVITVGRKGNDYFTRRGYMIEDENVPLSEEGETAQFSGVVDRIIRLFTEGAYDECVVAYTNFRSTFEQEPAVRTLLPLSLSSLTEMIRGIVPEKGKFSEEVSGGSLTSSSREYLFEPSQEAVFDSLVTRLMGIELHHAFLESKASEHSARMVAMRNASDKAKEVQFLLTRDFNKARQAAITSEMSEIIGGIEAMK